MKLTTSSAVPVYTIAGEGTSRPLPEWLARKRKRSLKKDAEYANRVELLQDFEFEEASQCVRVSEDGEWVVSTGTYKPQMHVHNLSQLALSYTRHTDALNQSFVLLSSDYSKSLHLQTDRSLEFHTPGGLHYTTRIPRYGRDLKYNTRSAEALVPSVGVNEEGYGEVFRLNLEVGRFMKGFEVDVGGDDLTSLGAGALQGGIAAGSVECAAIAEESHGLMAFGTSTGTVEFWDARSRDRVSVLRPPSSMSILDTGQDDLRAAITALEFDPSGLHLATGSSNGLIHTYDLRSPIPLLRKDQGFDSPIQTLQYLSSASVTPSSSSTVTPNKLLSSDRKSVKLFSTDTLDDSTNSLWTSIQPAVDLNHVAWVPDSGMLLTANEGRQQHAFFIPQLGPAPKWCSFLDNLVEEMDTDPNSSNPSAWKPTTGVTNGSGVGDVYDNYKFVSQSELAALNLDHLVGPDSKTNVLRPYMHGFFVPQRLYEQARLLANPDLALEQRQKSIQAKIEKERESRIRGSKKVAVKVNRKYAEKLAAREEANERRKALRMLRKQERADEGDSDDAIPEVEVETKPTDAVSSAKTPKKARLDLVDNERFRKLFEDEDYEIDEESREYMSLNPSSGTTSGAKDVLKKRGLTAVEEEDLDERKRDSSDEDSESDEKEEGLESARQRQRSRGNPGENEDDASKGRIGSASYKKSGHQSKNQRSKDAQQKSGPRMRMSSSGTQQPAQKARFAKQGKSFGDLASGLSSRERSNGFASGKGGIVGEKEVSFTPAKKGGKKDDARGSVGEGRYVRRGGGGRSRDDGRRSASGNTFRRM